MSNPTSQTITPDTITPGTTAGPQAVCTTSRFRRIGAPASERGQTTAEYALVLIAAATIAMLIVAWAGNTGAISDFFDTIIERITSMLP